MTGIERKYGDDWPTTRDYYRDGVRRTQWQRDQARRHRRRAAVKVGLTLIVLAMGLALVHAWR